MFDNGSFGLGMSSGGSPDCLVVTGGPGARDVGDTLGTLVVGQLAELIGAGNGCPASVVMSRYPALCFCRLTALLSATHDGGISVYLKLRRLPRLRRRCNGTATGAVASVVNGALSKRTGTPRALS